MHGQLLLRQLKGALTRKVGARFTLGNGDQLGALGLGLLDRQLGLGQRRIDRLARLGLDVLDLGLGLGLRVDADLVGLGRELRQVLGTRGLDLGDGGFVFLVDVEDLSQKMTRAVLEAKFASRAT